MSHRTVTATEFKAKCLALLDELNESGETLTITKRRKAAAIVNCFKKAPFKSMKGALVGIVDFGDITDENYYLPFTFDIENCGSLRAPKSS